MASAWLSSTGAVGLTACSGVVCVTRNYLMYMRFGFGIGMHVLSALSVQFVRWFYELVRIYYSGYPLFCGFRIQRLPRTFAGTLQGLFKDLCKITTHILRWQWLFDHPDVSSTQLNDNITEIHSSICKPSNRQ